MKLQPIVSRVPQADIERWNWSYLDITALGRQEQWEDSQRGPRSGGS